MAEYQGREEYRAPCPFCGRKFLPESLDKHRGPCERSVNKKRRVFDSSKQRVLDGELTHRQIKQAQKKDVPVKQSNWRAKHAEFVNSIRSARQSQAAIDSGKPLPPPPPPSLNPDYVQCPYCSRRFNESAAQRHMPFCKEQKQRIGTKPSPSAEAKARQNTRLQYQAPRLKLKMGSAASTTQAGSGPRGGSYGGGGGGGGYVPKKYRGNGSRDEEDYGGSLTPGAVSGKALRTGRDARAYEEARKDAKLRRPPASMNHSNNSVQSPVSYGRGSQQGYGKSSGSLPGSESGYNSGDNNGYFTGKSQRPRKGSAEAKFCHECGTRYPVPSAKFCCECGIKRMAMVY